MKRHLALPLLLLFAAAPAQAANRVVPTQYPTIQAAVDAAVAGDVVVIQPGVYSDVTHTPGGGDTTKCVVVMKSGVRLRGSGMGRTIIDANHLGRGIQCTNVTNVTIHDLTVREAFAAIHGAGILCKDGSSPTIQNVEFTSNFDGALICLNGSSPLVQGSRFISNAGKEGGAIAMDLNCAPVIENCHISGNTAPVAAAIIVRNGSAPQFTNCTVINNFISGPGGGGGALSVNTAAATITNSRFEGNTATGPGGALLFSEGVAQVTGCLIQGNSTTGAYGPGGGVHADFGSDVTMTDCTIVRNSVAGTDAFSDGGGVSAFFATQMTLRRCTISANSSASEGGGVAAFFSSPTIEKCIISHSTAGRGMACDESSVPVVSCTNIFGNALGNTICGTNGGNNFSLDPLFCNLAGNDFRLQAASPCAPGQHPNGTAACDGSRIGAKDVGCAPVDVPDAVPAARLVGNRPNPFRPETTIRYDLARDSKVELAVFDIAGRRVRTLVGARQAAGGHEALWDGCDEAGQRAPSGVYFYRLDVDGVKDARRMVLAR